MNGKWIGMLPLALALAACNSGSGTTDGTGSTAVGGKVAVLVTDDLNQSYSEVWVNIKEVEAVGVNGDSISLYDNPAGAVFNLAALNGVGALLNTTSLPAGDYTRFEVKVAKDVTLVESAPGGNTFIAQFDLAGARDEGTDITLDVTGNLSVAAGEVKAFALDFDLARFSYQAATNAVVLDSAGNAVVYVDDPSGLDRAYAELEGVVQSVDSATAFTLRPEHGDGTVTVNLHQSVVVVNEADGSVVNTTRSLQPNGRVEVYGNFDPAASVIEAVRVSVESDDSPSRNAAQPVSGDRVEMEGLVTAVDGASFTLDIHEASFMPNQDQDTIAVVGSDTALYSRGSQTTLTVGQRVEVKGTWNGDSISATAIEIEGAVRNLTDDAGLDDDGTVAELKGAVAAMNGDTVRLTVTQAEHVTVASGTAVDVDTSTAWFKQGAPGCLGDGARLEVKGSYDPAQNRLTATVVEVESPCTLAAAGSLSDDVAAAATGLVEVDGVVTMVNGGDLTLQVSHGDHVALAGQSIAVNVDGAVFEYGTLADVAADRRLEIKGQWDGATLTATHVEIKSALS